jgi:hypothetical protein
MTDSISLETDTSQSVPVDSGKILVDPANLPKSLKKSLKFLPLDAGSPITRFWLKFTECWNQLYQLVSSADATVRTQGLELINGLLTDEAFQHIQIEATYGEINRAESSVSSALVELYISPRLLRTNIPLMEAYYAARPTSLPNLAIYKYRAYHPNDALIDTIEYPATDLLPAYTANYLDVGCQSSIGYDGETKMPVLNIVIYVKKALADVALAKKTVTFRDPAKPNEDIKMDKWLPNSSTVFDVLLVNVLGEFNLMHRVGYIEFLPEGDPMIAAGSIFSELADLKKDVALLEKNLALPPLKCKYCERHQFQGTLLQCARCKTATYCSKLCQKADYSLHKKSCKLVTTPA